MRHAAQLLEIWRLCGKSRCRRVRACQGDLRRCSEALADWFESLSMKDKRVSFAEALARLRAQSISGVIPAPACAKPKHPVRRSTSQARLRFGEGRKAGIQ